MTLTPLDIMHKQYKTSFRGYKKAQVDEFMKLTCSALEETLKEKKTLSRRIELLEEEVESVRKIESALAETLVIAQKTADEIRASSHKQAESILRDAEDMRLKMTRDFHDQMEKCRADISLLESTKDRFECEFRAVLQGYIDWLDNRKIIDEIPLESVAEVENV